MVFIAAWLVTTPPVDFGKLTDTCLLVELESLLTKQYLNAKQSKLKSPEQTNFLTVLPVVFSFVCH